MLVYIRRRLAHEFGTCQSSSIGERSRRLHRAWEDSNWSIQSWWLLK